MSILSDGVGAVGGGIGTMVSGAGGAVTDGVGRMRRMSVSMAGGRLPFLAEIEESTSPTKLETAVEKEGSDEEDDAEVDSASSSRSPSRGRRGSIDHVIDVVLRKQTPDASPTSGPRSQSQSRDDDEDQVRGALPFLAELKKAPVSSDRDSEELTPTRARTSTMGRMRCASISEVFRGRALTETFPSPRSIRSSDGLSQDDDNGSANGQLPPLSLLIDEDEAVEQQESLVIHIVIREDNGHEVLHVLECEDTPSLEKWLGLLQQSRSFHQNYHKTTVTFGEFLCGMASLKRTPLAHHFVGLQVC